MIYNAIRQQKLAQKSISVLQQGLQHSYYEMGNLGLNEDVTAKVNFIQEY